jgi:hypothetical protein
MLKYFQNYCLRRCPRARPQKIDGSANIMVVFANRLYIDTYLFVINIEYLLFKRRSAHTWDRVFTDKGTQPFPIEILEIPNYRGVGN